MSLNDREPPPTAGRVAVWPEVISDVESLALTVPSLQLPDRNDQDPYLLAIADMRERDRIGTAKYGTPLMTHNGRDALVDGYQEALDLAVYLKQRLLERPAPRLLGVYLHTLVLVVMLREEIEAARG